MERIPIIGISGSGKSTFANKLGKALNREVIHLDKVYYPHPFRWEHLQNRDEWKRTVRDLVAQEKWIIDGHYNSTLNIRVPRADTVIFFNFNKFLCLYRVCKRALDKTQPFDKAKKEDMSKDEAEELQGLETVLNDSVNLLIKNNQTKKREGCLKRNNNERFS